MAGKGKSRKRKRQSVRRAYASLGHLRAEDDPNLPTYFIDERGFLDRALDHADPAMVFRGPKGVGKSAILRMVATTKESEANRVIWISPDDLAFTAFANVSADTPLLRNAVNNQWLFKSLWNYVFSVELLSREYKVRQPLIDKFASLFDREEVKSAKRLLSMALTDEGELRGGFTETLLKLVHEVEVAIQTNEAKVLASAKLREPGPRTASQLQILSLVDRVTKSLQTLLAHKYYILIDDLDLHWANEPVQNALIAALFTSMAKLNRTERVKFVVAIRDDIYRHLPIEDKDKSRDWICDVGWDKPSLRTMLEKRVQVLHGVSRKTLWEDLLPSNALDVMIVHSLGRPRELIRHLQLAIEVACGHGHESVTQDDLTESLRRASAEKLEELEQEFDHTYPGISWIAAQFAGKAAELSLDDIKDVAEMVTLKLDEDPRLARYAWALGMHENPLKLARCLMEVGFLLIKTSRTAPPQSAPSTEVVENLDDPWFAVRPMYRPGLSIKGT